MKKIAIISESPNLPTGFARSTRIFADMFVEIGLDVTCFGIGHWGEALSRELYKYQIWGAGGVNDDFWQKFPVFFRHIRPDMIFINYDLITILSWAKNLERYGIECPAFAYLILDGLPVDKHFVDLLNSRFHAILTPTKSAAVIVRPMLTKPVYYVPHLVDTEEFFPIADSRNLRPELYKEKYLVGIFAQNRPRKQISQVLQAIKILRKRGIDVGVILHTDLVNATFLGGENLKRIVSYIGLSGHIYFNETSNVFDVASEHSGSKNDLVMQHRSDVAKRRSELGLNQRINLCDVVVVASSCGGFEYSIVESQASRVPVCVTDDGGNMREVAGNGACLMEPALFDFTSYGAMSFRLAPKTIADCIEKILIDSDHRADLIEKGSINVQRFDRRINSGKIRDTILSITSALIAEK